jgi:AcrR family transcriptional regulator
VPLRVDARRNLEQLLAAASDLVAEKGAGVALDEVAQRAGVGIATLYRRFPDRTALLRGVVLHSLDQTRTAAERAAEEHDDAFEALAAYLRAALELRVAAVIPLVLDVLDLNAPVLAAARVASARATEELVDAAHASGQLPEDVTFADVGMMLVRIARPLPGPLPDELKHELARRHLELFVRGLGRRGDNLVGPALSRDGLAQIALRDAESSR